MNLDELLRVNRLEINTKTEQKASFEIVQSMTEQQAEKIKNVPMLVRRFNEKNFLRAFDVHKVRVRGAERIEWLSGSHLLA